MTIGLAAPAEGYKLAPQPSPHLHGTMNINYGTNCTPNHPWKEGYCLGVSSGIKARLQCIVQYSNSVYQGWLQSMAAAV